MERIPQVWPGWQADELIGQGSYGRVYKASRTVGGHTSLAAIKVIDIPQDQQEVDALRDMNMDALSIRAYFEEAARSVIDEIAVMERLKASPNVVHIEDYQLLERDDGVGWCVLIRMELLEALTAYQRRQGLPTAREAARIGADICSALGYCHDAGIIHRDVKPENVFRSEFGSYKLGDFGISKRLDEATRSTKSFAGSRPYMAPEVESGHYDQSVDTYSLGVMLYRWLNGGRPPFLPAEGTVTQGDVQRADLRRFSGERPPLPAGDGVDPALAAIVRRAVEYRPQDRWPSAVAFGEALQGWLDGGAAPTETSDASAVGTVPKTGDTFPTVDARDLMARVAAEAETAERARQAEQEQQRRREQELEQERKAKVNETKRSDEPEAAPAEQQGGQSPSSNKAGNWRDLLPSKGVILGTLGITAALAALQILEENASTTLGLSFHLKSWLEIWPDHYARYILLELFLALLSIRATYLGSKSDDAVFSRGSVLSFAAGVGIFAFMWLHQLHPVYALITSWDVLTHYLDIALRACRQGGGVHLLFRVGYALLERLRRRS